MLKPPVEERGEQAIRLYPFALDGVNIRTIRCRATVIGFTASCTRLDGRPFRSDSPLYFG